MPALSCSRTAIQKAGLAVGLGLALLIALCFNPVPDKPAIGAVAAVVALMQKNAAEGLRAAAQRRADNAELLNALPSLPIARASVLEALAESRAER